jgi:uncharacterized membrane protein YraQ (UPF0718 family)
MKQPPRRDYTPIFLALVAVLLVILAWNQGGVELAWEGVLSGGSILISVIPLLIAAFLTAGLIQSLVSRELVSRWLGASSGWRGLFLACLGGALIPGGPYVYYPIAGALLNTGAGLGVLMAFILAKNLWSVSRIPMELALLGPDLTFIRYAITFAIPPLLGFLAETLFGRYLENIREGAKR